MTASPLYDEREFHLTVKAAAAKASKPERTVYFWCKKYRIGVQRGPKLWEVSEPALLMLAQGDLPTLIKWQLGDRESASVASYYARAGLLKALADIQGKVALSAVPAISATQNIEVGRE